MSDQNRELGVEFGDLSTKLKDHEYPASQDELLDAYGDEQLEMGEQSITFEELIGPLNEDRYRDYEEVEQAMMNMVSDDAIGRKNYSDRTPPAPGEDRQEEGAPGQDGQREQESF